MKKNITPSTALASDSIAEAVAFQSGHCGSHLTAPASLNGASTGGPAQAVPSDILLNLGTLYATTEINAMLGESSETVTARGVQAGLVVALHAILPPAQFRAVMIQWEVDAIRLSELLHLAGASATPGDDSEPQIIEV